MAYRAIGRVTATVIALFLAFGLADQAWYFLGVDAAATFAMLLGTCIVGIWGPPAARWTRTHSGGARP
jgi:hypothetical protein